MSDTNKGTVKLEPYQWILVLNGLFITGRKVAFVNVYRQVFCTGISESARAFDEWKIE